VGLIGVGISLAVAIIGLLLRVAWNMDATGSDGAAFWALVLLLGSLCFVAFLIVCIVGTIN
jgi:hypothetical protein